jgi:hypothetical protein
MTEQSYSLPDENVPPPPEPPSRTPDVTRVFWQGKFWPAFWTIAGIFSVVLNVILIIVVIMLARNLFVINDLVEYGLINGLYDNFVKMDEATIVTTVQVEDTIPVVFDLPVQTNTTVTLTEPTPIYGAQVTINTGNLYINAPADIILPAGTLLPIYLDIVVPVDQRVPVTLTVPVDIPLNQTELHEPFVGLQEVIAPYHTLLGDMPDEWEGIAICQDGVAHDICAFIFGE